jgi:hypothetical protein
MGSVQMPGLFASRLARPKKNCVGSIKIFGFSNFINLNGVFYQHLSDGPELVSSFRLA